MFKVEAIQHACESCHRGLRWGIKGPDNAWFGLSFESNSEADFTAATYNRIYGIAWRAGAAEFGRYQENEFLRKSSAAQIIDFDNRSGQ